ncbi:MAG TPA: hypothetical protein VMW87_15940 [Spirochaetia bacterium]|nr:hypothetical protein [Spirochaetia bacterium]
MPVEPIQLDIVAAQMLGSGQLDLKRLITETYDFADSIKACEYAVNPKPTSVKIQILLK